jgi:hypothetical protein
MGAGVFFAPNPKARLAASATAVLRSGKVFEFDVENAPLPHPLAFHFAFAII